MNYKAQIWLITVLLSQIHIHPQVFQYPHSNLILTNTNYIQIAQKHKKYNF